MEVETVQSWPVSIDATDGAVKVTGHRDPGRLETDNGVIHVIGMVITPEN